MNEIILWKDLYRIEFKEGEQDKLITPEAYIRIKEDLINNRWIEINNELYNPFEVRKVVKCKSEAGIELLLENLSKKHKREVRQFMNLYKKELTMGVVQNMINKVKGIY